LTTSRRIGVLGGTFDPIHQGHLEAALAAESALALQRVHVVTSNTPPHRPQPRASSYHRFAMVSLALSGRAGWRASDLELRDSARSYTAATLQKFHERGYAPTELYFIIGSDAFADIMSWMDYPAILTYTHFAVVSRPGHKVDDLPSRLPTLASRMERPRLDRHSLPSGDPMIVLIDAQTADVSSTAIRDKRARGETITGLVPGLVQQHIEQHGLYTSTSPGRRGSDASAGDAAGGLHGQD
jgi:nicotinate-nucleotide adenylyltransferase